MPQHSCCPCTFFARFGDGLCALVFHLVVPEHFMVYESQAGSPIAVSFGRDRGRHLSFVNGYLCRVPLLLPLQAEGLPTKAAGSLVGPWTWCEGRSVSEQNSDIPNHKYVTAVLVSALC